MPEQMRLTVYSESYGAWKAFRKLGEGGQGIVYLAVKKGTVCVPQAYFRDFIGITSLIANADSGLSRLTGEDRMKYVQLPDTLVAGALHLSETVELGALKVLRAPGEWSRDPENAAKRHQREVQVLSQVSHRNLIKLLDSSDRWYVTPFYRRGTVDRDVKRFVGRPIDAMRAIRAVADAVALLHRQKLVHRDIKPENLFVSDEGELILGDFGLVHDESAKDRLTKTFDNTGSRDWMPPWLVGLRIEEPPDAFDVYALGKVLWALVAGVPRVAASYSAGHFDEIAAGCHDDRAAEAVSRVIAASVSAEESGCLSTAEEFIAELDEAIADASLPVRATTLRMAGHILSRPGPPFLLSVDAPATRKPPSTPSMTWMFRHSAAAGRGTTGPGMLSNDSPVVPDEPLWHDFLRYSKDHARWLICPPEPRSSDHYIDLMFPAISMRWARYIQFGVSIDNAAAFRLQVHANQRWLSYSPPMGAPTSRESEVEFRISVPELAVNGKLQFVSRDLLADTSLAWGRETSVDGALEKIRLRGAYELLFIRIL